MRLANRITTLRLLALICLTQTRSEAQPGRKLDRVILGGMVMDPATGLNAARNIGLRDGRIASITRADRKSVV